MRTGKVISQKRYREEKRRQEFEESKVSSGNEQKEECSPVKLDIASSELHRLLDRSPDISSIRRRKAPESCKVQAIGATGGKQLLWT